MKLTLINNQKEKEYIVDSFHYDHNNQQLIFKVKGVTKLQRIADKEYDSIRIEKE
jgi:hypothetical protein